MPILDRHQIRPHHNLVEALNNLVMLFASTTSTDDIKLFEFHLKELNAARANKIKMIKFPVDHLTSYDWTHSNLNKSVQASYLASEAKLGEYVKRGAGGRAVGRAPRPSTTPAFGAASTPVPTTS